MRVGKLSGAVGTYTVLSPEVEAIVCGLLGLKVDEVSTQVIQRDRHAAYFTALAVTAGTIERLCVELRHLQRTEVREVEEPFRAGQKGSSAMPHKRNPINCEKICGLSRVLRGYAMAAMEDVALWHERDISHSSVERVIMPDSTILTDYVLHRLCRLLEGLRIMPENMARNMECSFGLYFSPVSRSRNSSRPIPKSTAASARRPSPGCLIPSSISATKATSSSACLRNRRLGGGKPSGEGLPFPPSKPLPFPS